MSVGCVAPQLDRFRFSFASVKFAFLVDRGGTKLVFDHRGFPEGQGGHLAEGWHRHYWDPLMNFLSQNVGQPTRAT